MNSIQTAASKDEAPKGPDVTDLVILVEKSLKTCCRQIKEPNKRRIWRTVDFYSTNLNGAKWWMDRMKTNLICKFFIKVCFSEIKRF